MRDYDAVVLCIKLVNALLYVDWRFRFHCFMLHFSTLLPIDVHDSKTCMSQ